MTDFIEIHWATGNIDEARRVCRYLVQERLVACTQITPWAESTYMWDNEILIEQETKVVLKTHQSKYEEVKTTILKNTSHEIPEILVFSIIDGSKDYINWLCESTMVTAP